ncbi:MAG: tetratricopeptide repeat protein [Actinomycetota bacterium]
MVAASPIVKSAAEREGDLLLRAAMAALSLVALVSAYYAVSLYVGDRYFALAINNSNLGYYENAFGNYERAIKLYKNGRYYDYYGRSLEDFAFSKQDYNLQRKAASIYALGKKFEPYESDHYRFLGNSLIRLASSPDDPILNTAIKELETGIKIRPYNIQALKALSSIFLYQGRYKEAIDSARLALKINPEEIGQITVMAKGYEKLGNIEKAKQYYEKLLALSPDNQEAKDFFARTQFKLPLLNPERSSETK